MRYRWIILATVLLGVPISLATRYWPHLVWKTAFAKAANGVEAIPTKPMIVPPADEPLSTCTIGPVSFKLPASMTEKIEFRRGMGGVFAAFRDAERSVTMKLPEPDDLALQDSIVGFPDKAKLTFSRLYVEICEAKSSDFSFAMSQSELDWHGWLLSQRLLMPDDLEVIEYLWRDDVDGHLIVVSTAPVFQWSTTDSKWQGYIYFHDVNVPATATDWMRRTSASLAIDGDPAVFSGLDEQAVEAMMVIANEAR